VTLQAHPVLEKTQTFHSSSPPAAVRTVAPEYTKEATEAKLQGDVVLATMIGIDGIPSDIKVVRGLGRGLDEKAVECVQKWRFKPATRNGEPIPMKAQIEVNFRLP
jgi:protein TonB